MLVKTISVFSILFGLSLTAFGASTGVVRGIVHDPHHRPIANATVRLSQAGSAIREETQSSQEGEFRFANLSAGRYSIEVEAHGFRRSTAEVTVGSATTAVVHFPLEVVAKGEEVNVKASSVDEAEATSAERVVTHEEIEAIPAATRTDSLTVITESVPGATIVHNQLHLRGGHQVEWMVDGVPLPNTSIASNVGPQFDPKTWSRSTSNAEVTTRNLAIARMACSTWCRRRVSIARERLS